MKNDQHTGSLFTLAHVALMTGLTDRTIRSHIAAGFLQGEKINGLWHFTPEQVNAYIRHSAVRPGLISKERAAVLEFLDQEDHTVPAACIILDLPGEQPHQNMEFFCRAICDGHYEGIRFSFDAVGKTPRIILSGPANQVLELTRQWQQEFLEST